MKVYSAICAITAEMSKTGIEKKSKNSSQGYMFRGIDAVYGALSPLLAQYKLCVLPRVVERTVTEQQSKNGGILFYTTLKVEFDFVSAEDGSKHTVCTVGEAMDSGDKSSNKAMSAAYKYACFQAFCIPTEGDNDADAHTHEVVRGASKGAQTRNANEHAERISEAARGDKLQAVRELVIEGKEAGSDFWTNVWMSLPANVKHYIRDNMKDAA
jgi:hypothetical protein